VSGQYFANSKPKRSSVKSYDHCVASRLWKASADLVGLPRGSLPTRSPRATQARRPMPWEQAQSGTRRAGTTPPGTTVGPQPRACGPDGPGARLAHRYSEASNDAALRHPKRLPQNRVSKAVDAMQTLETDNRERSHGRLPRSCP
jgi:hypothetical protein